MAPGAEPGFHLAFFLYLVVVGLANPGSLVAGIAAGLLLRRWWLALLAAFVVAVGWNLAMLGRVPDRISADALTFPLAFSLSAPIWAAVVQAARRVVRSNDRL